MRRNNWSAITLLLLSFTVSAAFALEPATGKRLPKWNRVVDEVRRHMSAQRDFQPADLITRSQVAPVFEKLAKIGWNVSDKDAILSALPSDGDFIVKQLQSADGRKFMRSISRYPDVYDRLDKFSQIPDGESSIRTLIKGPGGNRMLDFLSNQPGREQAADFLEPSPKARNFNRPTGRIYTLDALLTRLESSYRAAETHGTNPASQK